MRSVRNDIGGLGNLLFKEAFIWGQMRDGKIPDVYIQSPKYWEKYKDEIRMRFGANIGNNPRVALHIRRGDYLKASQFHVNLWETDYYKNAVSKVYSMFDVQTKDSMTDESPKFLVFCKDNQNDEQDKDDHDWCLKNIPSLGIDFEIYNHTTEVEDLNAMASCEVIIMANSSFSWWAAFLGNPNKVICPKAWFTDNVPRTDLLDEWIKI